MFNAHIGDTERAQTALKDRFNFTSSFDDIKRQVDLLQERFPLADIELDANIVRARMVYQVYLRGAVLPFFSMGRIGHCIVRPSVGAVPQRLPSAARLFSEV